MYIVTLPQDLIQRNHLILASSGEKRLKTDEKQLITPPNTASMLSGTVYQGYNQVYAQLTAGSQGSIELHFELSIPSISAATFASYRDEIRQILSPEDELHIAIAAGIKPPPPQAATKMANYGLQLFAQQIVKGVNITAHSISFNAFSSSADCQKILLSMRQLAVVQVQFSGSLALSSHLTTTQNLAVYLPITSIVFGDGLTIPFSAYATNALITETPQQQLTIPEHFWS